MKRTFQLGIGLLALAGLLATAAAGQSLGDYARQQRAKKGPAAEGVKEYTNDNLPTSGALSEVGQPAPPPPAPLSPKAAAAAEKAEKASAEERKKLEAEWRAKFAEQKKNIAQMERELEVLIRENKLRQAAYSVSPDRLQGSTRFAQDDQKYQSEIDAKRQGLEEAKQKLEDMKEDLRKAGLPASWAE